MKEPCKLLHSNLGGDWVCARQGYRSELWPELHIACSPGAKAWRVATLAVDACEDRIPVALLDTGLVWPGQHHRQADHWWLLLPLDGLNTVWPSPVPPKVYSVHTRRGDTWFEAFTAHTRRACDAFVLGATWAGSDSELRIMHGREVAVTRCSSAFVGSR